MGLTVAAEPTLKRTPLWTAHQKLGARLVEFGGWEMPVQYSGIVDEHHAVRTAAGLFDISHMGEIFVTGPAALDFLNSTLTNDLHKCEVGQAQYTLACNSKGGVIDDLYAYRLEPMGYLLIVNASRIDDDVRWLEAALGAFPLRALVELVNASDRRGALAVQGPKVSVFIDRCWPGPSVAGKAVHRPSALQKNEIASFRFHDSSVWLARTGYTGEDGFEMVAPSDLIEAAWTTLMEAGQPFGLKPCGLGARDTLRTEMGYPLYGHELDENTTPLEAGLGTFVALDKGEFSGRAALAAQKGNGLAKRCIAFKCTDKCAPPRPHYPIWSDSSNAPIGEVASGTQSPSLGLGIGMGYVPPAFAKPGTPIRIEVRSRFAPAQVVSKPIYRKPV
jgi:aminomethyltransferase